LVRAPVAEMVTAPVNNFKPALEVTDINPSAVVVPLTVNVEVFESNKVVPDETAIFGSVIGPK
jgi:hypothetical protein